MASISFLIYGSSSFTKKGFEAASKQNNWEQLITPTYKSCPPQKHTDLRQKSFMITGANSGLGLICSQWFANHGGIVHMVCRNKEKGEQARQEVINNSIQYSKSNNNNNTTQSESQNNVQDDPSGRIFLHVCDVSKPSDIKSFVQEFERQHSLDVLVNNAGAMLEKRSVTSDGLEITFATNTISTFLLTNLLIPTLKKSSSPRVIAVSSGGMLTEKLLFGKSYECKEKDWVGRDMYAKTKRHQVVLTELWAQKYTSRTGISFYSMHPGWVDTPGLAVSMPSFYNTFKNSLRTVEEGADTIFWLATTDQVGTAESGEFFRDHQKEVKHLMLGFTKYSAADASNLWEWCSESANWSDKELESKL